MVAIILPQPIMPHRSAVEDSSAFRSDDIRNASLDYALHILIIGADNPNPTRADQSYVESLHGRADTLILARFDPKQNQMALLSIPRDTRAEIPDHGMNKINVANALGGPILTARTVSTLLGGIPIDRYVRLNPEGIQDLVDAIGGVEVYVPERMEYTDHTQKLYIDLQPGWQRLNGEQVHHFARYRHDHLGDIGRVQRQQELIRALSQELLQPGTWTRTPQVLEAIQANVDTNLRWDELLSLAQFTLSYGQERLDMIMLPGRFSQPHEFATSYWLPDSDGTYQVAVNYFDASPINGLIESPPPAQLKIAVQNASGQPGIARRLTQDLQEKGFLQVFPIEDDPLVLTETEIIAQRGDTQGAEEIRATLGLGSVRVESTGAIESDVTIRVGQDWVQYWYPQDQASLEPTS